MGVTCWLIRKAKDLKFNLLCMIAQCWLSHGVRVPCMCTPPPISDARVKTVRRYVVAEGR